MIDKDESSTRAVAELQGNKVELTAAAADDDGFGSTAATADTAVALPLVARKKEMLPAPTTMMESPTKIRLQAAVPVPVLVESLQQARTLPICSTHQRMRGPPHDGNGCRPRFQNRINRLRHNRAHSHCHRPPLE
jgi:hypothetical protein